MSDKGFLKISNNSNISMPTEGKTNSYTLNSELPCFFIKNHHLYPLEKSYSIKLPNPVSIEADNMISFNLKLPKQILSQDFTYEINNFSLNVKNLSASLQFKSSNSCNSTKLVYDNNSSDIEVNDYCGWITIKFNYTTIELCNLCEINYSICFDDFKLKTLKGGNKSRAIEIIPLDGILISFDLINLSYLVPILRCLESHTFLPEYDVKNVSGLVNLILETYGNVIVHQNGSNAYKDVIIELNKILVGDINQNIIDNNLQEKVNDPLLTFNGTTINIYYNGETQLDMYQIYKILCTPEYIEIFNMGV
jgi:hypothetical protein